MNPNRKYCDVELARVRRMRAALDATYSGAGTHDRQVNEARWSESALLNRVSEARALGRPDLSAESELAAVRATLRRLDPQGKVPLKIAIPRRVP